LGGTRFALARALVEREPVRAHGLATSAAADFAEAGPAYARERGEVEVWLAEHPLVEGGEVGEAGEGGAASGAEKGPSDVAAP
ncbi:MAG: hypothetical protein H6710_23615, partial [Myxococcales bacterium]|nr:hypothetical protein [Myxococcales bacterium]